MNRIYQRRKEKLLERKRESWNAPQFSNQKYYEQTRNYDKVTNYRKGASIWRKSKSQ